MKQFFYQFFFTSGPFSGTANVENNCLEQMNEKIDMLLISLAVIWDPAGAPRNDGPGTKWSWENCVYPRIDESDDWHWHAPQGNENEPQGYYSSSDVWAARCCHKWLDRWNILYLMEKDSSC